MGKIDTIESLRRILGEPRPATIKKVLDRLDDQATDFVRTSAFAVLATLGADGTVEASPKGDEPGFVRVEDEATLLMPERAGNNLAFGLQNIIATGKVAVIFLKPRTGETLRVTGRAEIFDDADLLAKIGRSERPALLAIRIHVARCYFHCARAMLRSKLWEPDSWPAPGRVQFGRIIAPRVGGDDAMAREIDDRIETGYATRLWTNS
ncbi:MAG: pyridoxamine 5'-phosphate oxidase family protein [Hyphomicrobiales bacterium]|nr:pyridoxamine 5'-phosphate oxidase family protein [Hyphomicrobiales bacterium]